MSEHQDFARTFPRLAVELEDLDALVQEQCADLEALTMAIAELTTDETIHRLAVQANVLAGNAKGAVNDFAEELGCNYSGGPIGAYERKVPLASHEEPGAVQ